MASFVQNYVQGMVQNAAMGAATYAITTGGRVVGDVVIGAGDLIEGAGRNVGNSVEGYIDRYGNWIRSYGDGAISATAASSGGPNAYRTAVKPGATAATGTKQKAIGGPNKPGTKALPAPKRPGLKKSASDAGYTPPAQVKPAALPSSGVRKALPPAGGAVRGGAELSKGQLAKLRGVRAEDLKKPAGGAVGAVGAVGGALGGGAKKAMPVSRGAVGGAGDAAKNAVGGVGDAAKKAGPDVGVVPKAGRNKRSQRKPAYAASSAGGSEAGKKEEEEKERKKRSTPGAAVLGANKGGPPAAGAPQPFQSPKRADGKVVVSKESKPRPPAGRTMAKGDGPKPKDDKGNVDFMRLMAEEPKKKGPGSVAGSVRSNATNKTNRTAKKAGGGGDGKQETSGKYDFF